MTYEALLTITKEWHTTESTPRGVADLLSTARATFTLAWFHYELLVVAASWSLLAVEAALRDRLDVGTAPTFKRLLTLAIRDGLLTTEDSEHLDTGRQLRNTLAHAQSQQAWTVGMAAPVVGASHHAVRTIYPEGHRDGAAAITSP